MQQHFDAALAAFAAANINREAVIESCDDLLTNEEPLHSIGVAVRYAVCNLSCKGGMNSLELATEIGKFLLLEVAKKSK